MELNRFGQLGDHMWKTIKNAFTPWNLIKTSKGSEHEGVRSVDLGQMLIDGTTGDVTSMARILEHGESASPPAPQPTDRNS